jgi:hypothetical protein
VSFHTWSIVGLCALPLLIWIPFRLWCDEQPHNDPEPDPDPEPGRERNQADIQLMA